MTNQENRSKDAEDLRQKAEALARERADRTPEEIAALSPEETRKTLHELRVHQIELEMQNEALRTALVQIEAGRARYSGLYDLAPVGYFSLSENGLILEVNLTAATLLGTNRGALTKQPISRFILEEDQDIYYLLRKKLIETGQPQKCELRLVKPDGARFWAHLTAAAAQAEDGAPVCRVAISDITESKRAEEDLRRGRHLLTATEALSAVGGWEWDVATQTMVWTDGTYHIHDFEPSAVPAGSPEHIKRSLACYDPEDQSRVEEAFRRCVEEGEPYDMECGFTTAKGRRLCVRTMGRAIREGGRTVKVMGNLQDITESKRAEEDLRERELRFQHMLSLVPDLVSIHDPDMTILYSNWKGLGAVPKERQNLKTKCYKTYRGYDDICPDCQVKTVLETRTSFQTEKHLPDGRWIDLRVIPFLDEMGNVEFFLEWVRDITNRIRAEETLRESEETHRALVDGLPDVVMRFDREGRHLFVSDNVREVADIEAAQFIGKTHGELGFPEALCRSWEESIQRVFDSNAPLETEFTVEGKTGAVTFDWRLVPERDAQGAVASVLSISRDITAHRKAEQEYKTLFREMLDGFALHEIICDAEGEPVDYRFLAVNPAFERMTGLKAEAIVGRTALEVLPGTERHWIETYGKVALSGEPVFFENYAAEQGKFFEVTAFRPSAGEFACVFQDITEHKRAEQEREQLQAQLTQAQKMESVGRLAGGVAHDFNNMLGVIIGHADLILEQMDPGQPFHADLTEIRKAGERSAHLTRQLLAFARKQTIAPKVLDLNDTLKGMLKMLQRLIGEDIDLSWRPGKELWPVKMDPAQIDQILANLCVNARDAIADVGKVTIETGNTVFDEEYCSRNTGFFPGEYVLLAVSDNGCGMDAETLSHLFEPFFSTKELGKGTGLGLATVFGVVKQNNGFISVYSEPGHGSTFKVYLPRHLVAKSALETKESRPRAAARGNESVLLVEDEPAILRMTTMMLEGEGYTVVAAGTPGEAIRLANEYAGVIHLLMTDVVMPEMNGRDLTKNIMSSHPDIKRLFMSGYTADVIAHHGVLDEGVHFIQKPFSKADLTLKVREVLDR